MDEHTRIIKVSEHSLEAFAVYDNDFYDVTLLPLAATRDIVIECPVQRRFTLDDLTLVLEKVVNNNVDATVFFFTWFEPLILHFYDALMLNRLFGDQPAAIDAYRLNMMPQTDDDLLAWMISWIMKCYKELSLSMIHASASSYIYAEDLLRMIDIHEDECMLPIEERTYIDQIKDDFIHDLDNDLILKDLDRYTKKLFIKYVNELCVSRNFNALRIKGFACLGGNSVFKCDYKEAAKCMEILWKEGGFGYAANTLGFIYLEGRLSDGTPDYEQAFKYFSIGHVFGISESTYKLAEMYEEGLCVAPNLEMAASLIEHAYVDRRLRFEQGDFECSFAEASMHMGNLQYRIYKENPAHFGFMRDQALDFYLQSRFAIEMRSGFGLSHSDTKIKQIAEAGIKELTSDMKIYKSSYRSSYPGPLPDFVSYRPYGTYVMTVKKLKNNRAKITVGRLPGHGENQSAKTLLTYREFACCSLADTITITANNTDAITQGPLLFDDISVKTEGGLTSIDFRLGTKDVLTVAAEDFTITRP